MNEFDKNRWGLTDEILELVGDISQNMTTRTMYGEPYEVAETLRDDVAYSVVRLNDKGKNIVGIGLNPRPRTPKSDDDSKEQKAQELESTRSVIIQYFKWKMHDESFAKLEMLDLSPVRTDNSGDLNKRVKQGENVLNYKNNLKLFDVVLKRADYIFLGYGGHGTKLLKTSNKDEVRKIFELLDTNDGEIGKVYALGPNADGSPSHPARVLDAGRRGNPKRLRLINRSELKKAMGLY